MKILILLEYINITANNESLKLQPIQLLEAVVSSSKSIQIHFGCLVGTPSPNSSDDQTKSHVIFSLYLFFLSGKNHGLPNRVAWLTSSNYHQVK